jgi:gas vesicle protein GvpL/GvpF
VPKWPPAARFSSVPDPSSAIYLFCLARSPLSLGSEDRGMDDQNPLLSWTFRDVVAVVSKVRREEFCGPEAETRMRDLAWMGPRACRHEAVIEKEMRFSPVLPARFATLFSSLQSLEDFLKNHYASIRRFLDRVAGKDEWAVKGMLERKKANEAMVSEKLAGRKAELAGLSQGARYFLERRLGADVQRELPTWLQKICEQLVKDLGPIAATFLRRPVLSVGTEKEDREMVMNFAFLLPRNAGSEFHKRISEANASHSERGLNFEITGPWPAYSFSASLWTSPRV